MAGANIRAAALLVLWGSRGIINSYPHPLEIWREYCCNDVRITGKAIDSGHYLVEEAPDKVMEELTAFFGDIPCSS